ncbi:uncharacterized protein BT62DRAFT_927719 [Guyanagaster necrorhizus]|uniref:DH domain-containing protein n=1 Tax=Guyanagaster necrorhizus TaxID=856835 RepID=A0A9P7W1T6_9AGAR|nr:uncharacterized protein BT62DRAFT_927719 [Guyanagaster necrorhizus MCA 3950]KAG7450419.1 hypothetical protein BT62DRAFT_927719 [Guyanagaster necrorhizus MCA 3950]
MTSVAFDSAPRALPPLPPPAHSNSAFVPPPPNLPLDSPAGSLYHSQNHTFSAEPGPSTPSTPTSPTTPVSPSYPESKPKRSNPLTDLVDTEKNYVEQLTGIIRKVAAAWSRTNLPPAELDTMFRSIESVYKANRSLLTKLKEIGTNPSSPKALGDLLMRWIDDLEMPYTNYCYKYCCGFDDWDLVSCNTRLPSIIAAFSTALPPPTSLITSPEDPPLWTLDALFLLPKLRLKYYRKLYSRLLKSTVPGRSDHRLLVGALDKLDMLLDTLEQRAHIRVTSTQSPFTEPPMLQGEDEVVFDLRTQRESATVSPALSAPVHSDADATPNSSSSSARGSSVLGERLSRETATTSISLRSSQTMSTPISDLERRLSTERTLDIFTMKSKSVRLQMSPPTLTFKRELRLSMDVNITLTPRATGVEVVHRRGHVFLLSDLFLVCEKMTPEERSAGGLDGPDMWLCYPPLAGKVLRVSEVSGQETALNVAIMRKEHLFLQTESVQARNFMISEFRECIEFANSIAPAKQPPPPMPPLPGLPPTDVPQPQNTMPPQAVNRSQSISPPQRTSLSSPPVLQPLQFDGPSSGPPSSYRPVENGRSPPYSPDDLMKNFNSNVPQRMPSLDSQYSPTPNVQRIPSVAHSLHEQRPSAGGLPNIPMSISPGQVIAPSRSTSAASHHTYSNQQPRPPMSLVSPGERMAEPSFHQQPPPSPMRLPGPQGGYGVPPRPPSEPLYPNGMRKPPSTRSLHSQYEQPYSAPPLPSPSLPPNGYPPNNFIPRDSSSGSLHAPQPRPLLPSTLSSRAASGIEQAASFADPSPPNSPAEEARSLPKGPVTSSISAQMKCKVFLKQQHAQWKSLGSARLKLYHQDPTNIKQLVVESENKDHSVLISTIVLTDGVERVGKTGVAIELSDKGARTGIVYMIQLRNEKSAGGLFDSLLAGSDRNAN